MKQIKMILSFKYSISALSRLIQHSRQCMAFRVFSTLNAMLLSIYIICIRPIIRYYKIEIISTNWPTLLRSSIICIIIRYYKI